MTNEEFHDALYRERCRREKIEAENAVTLARIAELERENAELQKDAERIDKLEAHRQKAIARGFQWNTWGYDALQSDRTIRRQLDDMKENG